MACMRLSSLRIDFLSRCSVFQSTKLSMRFKGKQILLWLHWNPSSARPPWKSWSKGDKYAKSLSFFSLRPSRMTTRLAQYDAYFPVVQKWTESVLALTQQPTMAQALESLQQYFAASGNPTSQAASALGDACLSDAALPKSSSSFPNSVDGVSQTASLAVDVNSSPAQAEPDNDNGIPAEEKAETELPDEDTAEVASDAVQEEEFHMVHLAVPPGAPAGLEFGTPLRVTLSEQAVSAVADSVTNQPSTEEDKGEDSTPPALIQQPLPYAPAEDVALPAQAGSLLAAAKPRRSEPPQLATIEEQSNASSSNETAADEAADETSSQHSVALTTCAADQQPQLPPTPVPWQRTRQRQNITAALRRLPQPTAASSSQRLAVFDEGSDRPDAPLTRTLPTAKAAVGQPPRRFGIANRK